MKNLGELELYDFHDSLLESINYDRKNNKLDVIRHCAEVSEVASFAEVMQIKEAIEEAAMSKVNKS